MEDKKMKKTITLIPIVLLLICFATASAHAGAARRHTIEGFMLGTGVAILSAAIYNGIHNDASPVYAGHHPMDDRNYRAAYRHGKRHHKRYSSFRPVGHWETIRTWINPVYESKWNPGHYNRRGEWVDGRHENFLISDGYWQEEKVWVRY